jgi:phytoene dehydrogenase-like protein
VAQRPQCADCGRGSAERVAHALAKRCEPLDGLVGVDEAHVAWSDGLAPRGHRRGGDLAPPIAAGDGALNRIFGFAAPDEVEACFQAVLRGELPREIAGHLTVVSAHDRLQASPGPYGPLHTLRLQTFVPFQRPDGSWDRTRPAYREACWKAAVEHFEGLGGVRLLFSSPIHRSTSSGRFGTTRHGSIRQGALVAEQRLINRPHPSCSTGRTPLDGLYLGGGGGHPGVPGCLGGGYRAAGLVAQDYEFEHWWAAGGP